MSSRLGLRDWAFALAAFAPPGISKEQFPENGGQRYMMVDREAIILNYAASAAWKFHDLFGVGVTLEWIAVPRLDYSLVINANPAPGAANPVSSPLRHPGADNRLGSASPSTRSWAPGSARRRRCSSACGAGLPANIVTHSTLALTGPRSGDAGLTITTVRERRPANDVTVKLPLPMLVRGGGRYRYLAGGRELFDLELDVEYETWSRANAFTVDSQRARRQRAAEASTSPIGTITVPKQWRTC